jgi:ribulose-phosphate 3-epimerase
LGLDYKIEIDGGVELHNAAEVVRAGCDWLVAGSSIFHTPDPAASFVEMQRVAREAAMVKC